MRYRLRAQRSQDSHSSNGGRWNLLLLQVELQPVRGLRTGVQTADPLAATKSRSELACVVCAACRFWASSAAVNAAKSGIK